MGAGQSVVEPRESRFITAGVRMKKRNQSGFSLIEVMIVILIIMVISALAMPNVIRGIGSLRLRGAGSNLSGVIQRGRIVAVRTNRIQLIYMASGGAIPNINGARLVFVDAPPYNAAPDTTEPLVQIPDSVELQTDSTQTPISTFVTNSNTLLGFTVTGPSTTSMAFNARGLPCSPVLASGVPSTCNVTQGYVYFYRSTGAFGGQWIAVSVTPAGRIRVWNWDGTNWS
jgi:prepilin-type N-terminal cleavage/methylation domain-containing protein